jgi:hypothetical protein
MLMLKSLKRIMLGYKPWIEIMQAYCNFIQMEKKSIIIPPPPNFSH